jgi:hypothetical protein
MEIKITITASGWLKNVPGIIANWIGGYLNRITTVKFEYIGFWTDILQ